MIFDDLDLPVHFVDGGDTPANTGRIYILNAVMLMPELWYEQFFMERLSKLWVNEKLIRHPEQIHDECGSDQYEPIMLALLHIMDKSDYASSMTNAEIFLEKIFNIYLNNFFRSPNGDLPRPHHLSIWGRYRSNSLLLYLGDLFLLAFVVFRRLAWSISPGSVSNDVNLECMIRTYLEVKPTFLIKLARKIYKSRAAICTYFWADKNGRSDLAKYLLELYER